MKDSLKTILILNLDSDLANKFCKIHSKDFNIIGFSSNPDRYVHDQIQAINGDIQKRTKSLINKAFSTSKTPIDTVICNLVSANNNDTTKQLFNKNVTIPTCAIDFICHNWKKETRQADKKIININPLESGLEDSMWKSSLSAFNSSSMTLCKNEYFKHGIKYNTFNFAEISNKEYMHCATSVIIQCISREYNGEVLFINKENYTNIHLPINSSIFKYKDNKRVCDYKKGLKRDRVFKLSRFIKGITNLKVIDDGFKYAIIDNGIINDVIEDIEDEFNHVLANGLVDDLHDRNFFSKKDDFFYSYIPDVCSKSHPRNSKLIFANNTFKELLEDKFQMNLSEEVHIEYLYKKPCNCNTDPEKGSKITYFPQMKHPVSLLSDVCDGHGMLNIHQTEVDYLKKGIKGNMVREQCLTVIIPLNDPEANGKDGGISLFNKSNNVLSFLPKRHSMLLFENNDISYHSFLPNLKAEKMVKICFHRKVKDDNEKKIINMFEVKLEEGGEFGYIPPLSIIQKEI
jgi:hypothetical protein|tara:strand:+ start:604 stop:2148 length:1545 start_codon:yes stop_codon:yes gene_type:complete